MILNELFDRPAPVKWATPTARGDFAGTFTVGDIPYEFYFTKRKEGGHIFGFKVTDAYAHQNHIYDAWGNLGTQGTAGVQVLSTAVSVLLKFLSEQKPKWVEFSGSNFYGKGKLYSTMGRMLNAKATALGYTVKTQDQGDEIEFMILANKPPLKPKIVRK